VNTRIIYSVTALNRAAKVILEQEFPMIWVSGEISNLSTPASGHCYFTLKDAGAQIRCALFKSRARLLAIKPQNGAQVIACARLTMYEERGEAQLIIEQLEPAGLGELQRAFEAVKRKLQAEGVFDLAHKKSLPPFPQRLGVITSPTGAVLRDIATVAQRRFSALPIRVYPVVVQGRDAPTALVAALHQAGARRDCDVLILARGGGSLEDLWAFNDEAVARAIFACPIPIISAIGHEIDFTIADWVADARAPTPSAAAEMATPDARVWQQRLARLQQQLASPVRQRLAQAHWHVRDLRGRLPHPRQRLQAQAQRLALLTLRLRQVGAHAPRRYQRQLHEAQGRLAQCSPRWTAQTLASRLRHNNDRLRTLMRRAPEQCRARLAMLARALAAVSPLATLQRGYAIVRDERQRIVRDATQIAPGSHVSVRLAQGELLCWVESVQDGRG